MIKQANCKVRRVALIFSLFAAVVVGVVMSLQLDTDSVLIQWIAGLFYAALVLFLGAGLTVRHAQVERDDDEGEE